MRVLIGQYSCQQYCTSKRTVPDIVALQTREAKNSEPSEREYNKQFLLSVAEISATRMSLFNIYIEIKVAQNSFQ